MHRYISINMRYLRLSAQRNALRTFVVPLVALAATCETSDPYMLSAVLVRVIVNVHHTYFYVQGLCVSPLLCISV
jgi:hypothetical protein